ncbi:putative cyclin [Lupinus albus]|uniref:Putative cyclin n=1 Tax=Lupinus albus TaxID=3870 RepID=A0A6A4PE54_LUPAL|nr:putative cyclin [Lupinus albus]
MFLAGKVEETPRPLKDVILISYEIIHKKDPTAASRIKQKEVFDQQKDLILLGERVVLTTLGFSFNIQHPYKPLVEAIKKFNVAKNALAQVAWNFVNDGLRTSLFLQFKPHHIAAGAIFLAAKFLKVKLPSEGEKVWWQDFDVTPRQLEEVSNQMLELYEQNKNSQFQGSEVEGSAGGGTQDAAKAPSADEEQASEQTSSRSAAKHTSAENQEVPLRGTGNHINDGSAEMGSGITDHKVDLEIRDSQNPEQLPKDNKGEVTLRSNSATEQIGVGDQGRRECLLGYSPKDAIKMIDKDKVKAALKKRRKERGEMTLKKDVMDEDDLIERELEDGIELAIENEKNKEGRKSWSEPDDADNDKDHADAKDVKRVNMKGQLLRNVDADNEQEGEMIDDVSSPLNNHKRKKGSPLAGQPDVKKRLDSGHNNNHAE